MTGGTAAAWSARRSVRVDREVPRYTGLPALQAFSAPESLRQPSRLAQAPERRAGRPEPRFSRDQLARLAARLSSRDQAILGSLSLHHFLTTAQLQRWHFRGHGTSSAAARICRRVLARLDELHVIEHLERRVGGVRAGSASYVWRVGLIGDRLLRMQDAGRPRARRKEPSLRFLDHCLAVADSHLALCDLAAAGQLELITVATEPAAWRRYQSPTGAVDILKPGLYAVTASGEFEDHWFLEIDRATESLPTLLKKCGQYQAYRQTGQEQQRSGVFPWVLWIVPTVAHVGRLRRAIDQTAQLANELFRVCTLTDLPAVMQGGNG
jgi:protein involved in plasmid replication-relaxation